MLILELFLITTFKSSAEPLENAIDFCWNVFIISS